ncbi:hypothetical protein [Adhaeretor mobilis]|uniref:Uncharacterized protein n=1 Tax=Adhaeretor mobilis TaxID=1930276 RepID=A0A517MZ69_9BACT|nr:hypothetical protein [Adhaeretor mobilis]QDT00181.1 hypothetical protein HG15A2_35160 [Adhaeretor mobilis]
MQKIARLLQVTALAIPPMAMIAELSGNIKAGKMLSFLFVSACLFGIGYLLQQYTNPKL